MNSITVKGNNVSHSFSTRRFQRLLPLKYRIYIDVIDVTIELLKTLDTMCYHQYIQRTKETNFQGDEHSVEYRGMVGPPKTRAQKLISKSAVASTTVKPQLRIDYNQGEVMLGPLTYTLICIAVSSSL